MEIRAVPSLSTPLSAVGQCEHGRIALCQPTQQKSCLDTIDDMRVLNLKHIFATTVGSYTRTDVPVPSNRPLLLFNGSWLPL